MGNREKLSHFSITFTKRSIAALFASFLICLTLAGVALNLHWNQRENAQPAQAEVEAAAYTWEEFTVSSGTYSIRETSHVQIDADTAYIAFRDQNGEDLRFAKTTDGGDNWTDVLVDDGTLEVGGGNSIYAVDANTVYISYSNANDLRFAYSTDAGDTWTTVTAAAGATSGDTDVYAPTSLNPMIAFHSNSLNGGGLHFVESTDGGANWSVPLLVFDGATQGITIQATTANDLFVSFYDGSFADYLFTKSTDGGSSFDTPTLVYSTDADQSSYAAMDVVDANNIFFAIAETDVDQLVLATTTNGGSSWVTSDVTPENSGEPKFISMAAMDVNNIIISYVVGSEARTAETADGGSNWEIVPLSVYTGIDDSTSIRMISAGSPTLVMTSSNSDLYYLVGGAYTPPCYIGSNGLEYCVVTANIPDFDTGDEVCASLGRTCVGYTLYDESVCTQAHPSAGVDNASVNGSKAGYYCDGAPQTGLACEFDSNICKVCPDCNVGVSCSESIATLYREMYVQCGGAEGTNYYNAIYRSTNEASDFVGATLYEDNGGMNYGIARNIATDEDIPLFNDSFSDGQTLAVGEDTVDGGLFVAHAHNDSGTGSYDIYVTKLDSSGDDVWTTQIATSGCYYCANGVTEMVEDGSGGVFVLGYDGDVFAGNNFTPEVRHINSSGVVSFTYNTFDVTNFTGRMIADGSGGVYVVASFGYNPDFSTEYNGIVRRFTSSGLDATYNGGNGEQNVVTTDNGNDRVGIEVISDGAGGLVVLWIGNEGGGFGVYAQHIISDGSIDSNYSSDGELIVADANAAEPVQAALAGTHVYFSYYDFSTSQAKIDEFFLDLTTAWVCQQTINADSDGFDIVAPYFASPFVVWKDSNDLYAQQFNAGSGESVWSVGGELIDTPSNYGGSYFEVAFGNPSQRGYGTELGGVEWVYAADNGAGTDVVVQSFNAGSFAAGPGGDCVPVQPPTPISPAENVVRTDNVYLSARYLDANDTPGTTDYRISSSSLSDCVDGVNIVASDTSDPTVTGDEATHVILGPLEHGQTYYWCAQNDNGTDQSGWTQMQEISMNVLTPNLDYLSYLGGSGVDTATSIAVHAGIIYVTGETNSLDFPVTSGAYDEVIDSNDVYVSAFVLDSTGAADLQWATVYGGTADETLPSIDVSAAGVYLAGVTSSSDLPTSGSAYDTAYNGSIDAFFAVIALDGASLDYGTFLGGSSFEVSVSMQIDSDDAYIALRTQSSGFPTTVGAYDTTYNSGQDIVVLRLSPDNAGAADLVYSSFVGTSSNEEPTGVAVESGVFYVSGVTASAAFPTTAGAYDTTDNPGQEGVVFRLNPAGSGSADLTYSTYLGGSSTDTPQGLAVESGIIYVVGETFSTDFPTTSGAIQEFEPGGGNTLAFAAVIDPAGAGSADLQYSTYLAGANESQSLYSVVVDTGIMYVSGISSADDFPVTANAFDPVFNDVGFGSDGVLAILDPSGNGSDDLVYSTFIGTDEGDEVFNAVAFDDPYFYFVGEAINGFPLAFALSGTVYQQSIVDTREGYFGRINVDGGTPVPSAPALRYPDNGAHRAGDITLSALYDHPSLVGTTDYRVSTSSTSDCVNNVNVIDSGSSATTASNSGPTVFEVTSLANNTYYWCARNDDGTNQSDWTAMGSFVKDHTVPYLNYQSYLGGSGADHIVDIFIDSGQVYFTGTVSSNDFPGTVGVYDTTQNGGEDAIVGALSLDGSGASDLVFATYLGSAANENGASVKYVGGKLYGTIHAAAGTTIPTTGGAFDTTHNGFTDIYAYRMAGDGSALEYATFIGASRIDVAYLTGVVGGVMYMAGTAQSTGFPTTAGAYDTTFNGFVGVPDGVFVVLNPAGGGSSDLLYGSYYGSSGQDFLYSKRLVGTKFYFAMQAGNTVPTTAGAYDTSMNGGQDAVLGVFNPAGGGSADLEYASFYGGSSNEFMLRMDTDTSDNTIVITGYTASNNLPTTSGAYDEDSTSGLGNVDGFVVKLNPAGGGATDLVYATYITSDGSFDFLNQIYVDNGDIYLSGSSDSANFPVTSDAYSDNDAAGGTRPVFLVLSPNGAGVNDLLYSTYFNIAGSTYSAGNVSTIAVDGDLVYLAGAASANSLEMIADPGTPFDATHNGSTDGFITRFDMSGGPFVGGNSAPTAPTTLFSNNSSAQLGAANPTGITSATPVFSAICNDPDGGDIMNKYRVQVSTVNNFVSTVWDSGAAGTAMADCTAGSRSANITFGGAPLAQDGATYYWRIKFWDDSNAEGAYSEAVSTNTFTMATAGGGGGGGTSIQRLQTLQTLAVPSIGPVTVIGPDSVRFEWTYSGSGHTGFRLINDVNQVAVQVPSSSAVAATEEGLPHNTLVQGRKVTAYSGSGESQPSAVYPDVYTHMILVTPELVSRLGDEIRVTINENLNNLQSGISGIQFELVPLDEVAGVQVTTGEWVQQTNYTFVSVLPDVAYLLRARARNHIGVETAWSSSITVPVEDIEPGVAELAVSLVLTPNEGQSLQNPLNPNSIIYGEITVSNNGTAKADNVFVTLPIPDFISYIPGTLSVDGAKQTDGADGDFAQNGNDMLSSIWPELDFGFGHTVRFQLGFDTQRLIEEYVVPALEERGINRKDIIREVTQTPANQITDLRQVLAQALAAANPEITMQAQASHQDDPEPVFSNEASVEPDVAVLEQAIVAELESAPVPEPEPDFAPVPTPEQVVIIDQILQQEFPQQGQQTSQAPIPQGGTTSNSSGGSFSIQTSSGDNQLSMTGSVRTNDDQIQFTGTTSEPFSVVTLIFNGSVTAIAVSDANGNWQTFVSAEQLGISEGQSAQVRIEAIAAKGDLRSERVEVADVLVSRGMRGDVVAEFETQTGQQGIVRAVQETVEQTIEAVQENEPEIRTALVVSAPVVVVSSVPLWGYLPYAPTLIYHLLTYFIGLIGRKKKGGAARFYGVAYDSITKQPLALAIIRVYKVEPVMTAAASVGAAAATNKKLVTTIVTDKAGRYDALLQPATYQLEVSKPQYLFPSQIVTTQADGDFSHVYDQNSGIKVEGDQVTIPDVPLDPINAQRQWQLASGGKKVWMAFQRVGDYLAVPVLFIGALVSALVVIATPDRWINWAIAIIYILLLAMQIKLRAKHEKSWGVVYDIATNAVLPLTTVQLIEPASSKVVTSRLSDYHGRFAFLPEPGKYVIKASKPGYQQVAEVVEAPQTDRQPLHGEISIEKPDQRITGDVAMRQG